MLVGNAGADTLDGGPGIDTAGYGGPSGVTVNLSTSTGSGGHAAGDTLIDIENILGTSHNDTITGDDNANIFWASNGGDKYDGKDGYDVVDYRGATAAITLNLSTGTHTGWAAGDSFTNIEEISGTGGIDTMTGDEHDNVLTGHLGSDTLNGKGGNDTLNGGEWFDTLNGGAGNDTLNGGSEDDTLNGGTGDDTLNGDAGKDRLNGDAGNDILNGGSQQDKLDGGAGNDTLYGGEWFDDLKGGAGNDTLNGGAGNDGLAPGAGDDTVTGGAGIDRFAYSGGNDTITDYEAGEPITICMVGTTSDPTETDYVSWTQTDSSGNRVITIRQGATQGPNAGPQTVHGTITLTGRTTDVPDTDMGFGPPATQACSLF